MSTELYKKINDYFRSDVSGYLLYKDSEEELLRYYNLEKSTEGVRALNDKLKPFYNEIAAQNKKRNQAVENLFPALFL